MRIAPLNIAPAFFGSQNVPVCDIRSDTKCNPKAFVSLAASTRLISTTGDLSGIVLALTEVWPFQSTGLVS